MAERVVKVRLTAQVQEYQAAMVKAAQATRTVGTEAEKLAQKKQAFETLGRSALAAGGVMAAGIGLAVSKFADFDQAISNVSATGSDARKNLDALREAAIKAGASTVFSATESANAIEEMAKAGVEAKDILGGGLAGALDLAAAGGLGVAEAAGIAATALKIFNLEGTDMSHVADLLAAGAGKAMGDVSDLSMALAQGGQVAAATGLSIEETTAALSAFASQGLLGSDAGTSFKTMLQRLTPQSDEARAKFEELGVSAYDANGQFIGLAEFAGKLQAALVDLTPEQRNAALAVMFGSDAVRAANVIYQEGEEGIRDWISAVDDQGYAAETAATRLDNLKGDWEALSGAIDTAMITMGEAADGPLRILVQGLTGLVDKFNELPEGAQQAAFWVAAVGSAGGIALGSYLLLVPKVAEFKIALDTLGPSAQKAARGVGALARVGAVGAVIGTTILGVEALADAIASQLLPSAEKIDNQMRNAKSGVDLFATALNSEGITNTKQASVLLANLGAELDKVAESSFWNPASTSGTAVTVAKQLADIADSGDMALFSAQFRKLGEDANLTERQMRTFIKANPDLEDALTRQATAANMAADTQTLLNLALGEAVTPAEDNTAVLRELAGQASDTGTEVEDLADTIRDFGSANLDVRSAQRDFEESLDDVRAALKENGDTLDVTTEKGRANEAAIDKVAQSTLEYAAALYDQTGSQEDASDAIATGREELIKMLGKFGITGQAAQDYADKLGLIPENVETYVDANTDPASAAVDKLIRDIASRRAVITVDERPGTVVRPGQVGVFADGGAVTGPGTGTSDSVPAMLSTGEHVIPADEVRAAGGQDKIYRWREAMRRGVIPGYASGGAVSTADLRAFNTYVRRGDARADGTGGSALSLVDRLFDVAAQIGGKYGARLRSDALRSEKTFMRLEREADKANSRLEKAREKLQDLRDAASSMASRVTSAVRSFFNVGDLAASRTVTTSTSGSSVVGGIVLAGTGTTTTTENATTGSSIASSLRVSASRIKAFAEKVTKLSKRGINKALLEEIVSLGVEQGEPIVDALLAASSAEIKDINRSYDTIGSYSAKTGETVADANFGKLIDDAEKTRNEAKDNAKAIQKELEKQTTRLIKGITDALKAGTGIKKASGGPIFGPGSATSDSIPAWLSNGENVWSAAHVQAWGGQGNVERLKRLTPTAARYASGGPVGSTTQVSVGDVLARIDHEDMRLLAGEVASALVRVRSADAQEAVLAAARGVRG